MNRQKRIKNENLAHLIHQRHSLISSAHELLLIFIKTLLGELVQRHCHEHDRHSNEARPAQQLVQKVGTNHNGDWRVVDEVEKTEYAGYTVGIDSLDETKNANAFR